MTPYYVNGNIVGIQSANYLSDGFSINLKWTRAYPQVKTNLIAYHIYYGRNDEEYTEPNKIFDNYPNYIVTDNSITIDLYDFEPEGTYFFGIRALEYDAAVTDPNDLPFDTIQSTYNTLVRYYPQSLLSQDVLVNDTSFNLVSVDNFPSTGILKIGAELIKYTSVDYTNNIISTTLSNRGYNGTLITYHNIDGYDGYAERNPLLVNWIGSEERNTRTFAVTSGFDFHTYPYTNADGYRQRIKDNLTSDLAGSDEFNIGFPSYDFAGWHRTDPNLIISGDCVNSYIGGEQYCADGKNGVGTKLRGFNLQERINQQLEVELETTGEPVALIRRMRTGSYCNCYTPTREQPEERCPICLGSGFVFGWFQYFFTRRSDGRILTRFSPAPEDIKLVDAGYESELTTEAWTLTVPTIKDRDVLVRFDQDDNQDFRYEVINVTRNKTIGRLQGAQKMQVQRIRKTDPIYQIPVTNNTSLYPSIIYTTSVSSTGVPLHNHEITINENITSIYQINQTTQVSQGHNHAVVNGRFQEVLGHYHDILLPL